LALSGIQSALKNIIAQSYENFYKCKVEFEQPILENVTCTMHMHYMASHMDCHMLQRAMIIFSERFGAEYEFINKPDHMHSCYKLHARFKSTKGLK
jgi:hypothetical protein